MCTKNDDFLNCWEIKQCGRVKSNAKDNECISSKENMGHSCWSIAGTIGPEIKDCPNANKFGFSCTNCIVYKTYNRVSGTKRNMIPKKAPKEDEKYYELLKEFIQKKRE